MMRRTQLMLNACKKKCNDNEICASGISKENNQNFLNKDDENNPKLIRLFQFQTDQVLAPYVANETGTSQHKNYELDVTSFFPTSIIPKAVSDYSTKNPFCKKKTYFELQNVELPPMPVNMEEYDNNYMLGHEKWVNNPVIPEDAFNSDDSVQDPDFDQLESESEDSVNNEAELHIQRKKRQNKTKKVNKQKKLRKTDQDSNPRELRSGDTQFEKLEEEGLQNSVNNRKKDGQKKSLDKKARKILKNSGKDYTTQTEKTVNERKSHPLKKNCRRKCYEKIDDDVTMSLFKDYWGMGNYDKRVMFIASLINIDNKKSAVLNSTSTKKKNRQKTFTYFIDLKNERVQLCKMCFLSVFGETPKFLRTVTTKKQLSESGIPTSDERGKHEPPHKISEERKEIILNHINKFPAYESHYSRRHTTKRYLPSDLNKTKMYNLYCQENSNPVSIKIYSQMIDSLNLKFKKPHNDTCRTCDELKMKIECSKDQTANDLLKKELDKHHTEAEMAYNAKKSDKALAQENSNLKVIVFDLQQVLPTPYLTTGTVFYKRQLHTYNLTIHDCATNESFHFMWHEGIAGRRANEIASCLYKFLNNLDKSINHVIFYSDTCGGQNKNSYVTTMFTYILSVHENLKLIDHKFLVPGHTHMECDADHARIEKYKKKSPFPIHVPRDWLNLVRLAGQKFNVKSKKEQSRFTVVEMTNKDFFQFSQLLKGPLISKKNTEENKKLVWRAQKWIRYEKQFGNVKFKQSLSENHEFQTVNFRRRNSNVLESDIVLSTSFKAERPINEKKKKDLLELLPLIDDGARDFYLNLKVASDILNDTDPDVDRELSDSEF